MKGGVARDKFFYAASSAPAAMRAPYADRDDIGNGFNDYGGIESSDFQEE